MANAGTTADRRVADLMTTPPVTVEPTAELAMASRLMREHGVGSVIVVEGDRPVGIFTERDLVRVAAEGASPDTSVEAWMTPDPDTVEPKVLVTEAFRSLAAHGYRHIPVVDGGVLVGVISMRDLMRVSQIRPVQGTYTDVPKGLKGVVVAETAVGDVRGLEGFFHYRQYSAVELAQKRTFEDVWYLLFEGELPDREQRAAFVAELRAARDLPPAVAAALPGIARATEELAPLDALRTAVSLAASVWGFRPSLDTSQAELRDNAVRLCSIAPTLITAVNRLHHGLEPVPPRADLGHAANYLYMMTGVVPDEARARAIEQYLMLTIDHGFNASTFTARVIASTGADLGAAVTGAIGALSGPLHGGAPSRALDTLDAIGTPDNAAAWIRDAVERGERIMGFGHPVYKTDDPRSVMLRDIAGSIGGPLFEFAKTVERTIIDTLAELKPGRELYTNVEFYAGVVMEQCGLARDMFTPTFACSRIVGWCANILEQAVDNRIIRPSAQYIGPPPPVPVPAL